ncbi:RNA polymerase sigma factor, sigma-70 family [Pseudarcicella hirudinis]|uniref:RNA polymerase sigma factor, sigma-70 family n=1 Tax=Pseudarcicella hirudinis TaxID=1079859 RepID=A0A1I5MCE1_9BACT|nr:sigma-70 family RNA polymerase sigma factor [Pseudarcicella hirudinis]SFP07017.1 RNA polymerase sigma factor, sigma-70 family [Pseudarcicella hirudinis]
MKISLDNLDQQVTDSEIWCQFKSGDEKALSELMSRYFRSLLHYGTKFTRKHSLIEDVIQDLFLELLERRNFIGNPPSVKNYLFKALRNNLIRAINDDSLSFSLIEKDDLLVEIDNIEEILVKADESEELHSKINHFFTLLSKRQKEALFLKYYENLSNDEIAQIMGINKQSVSNLLQQSITILRNNWVLLLIISLL